MALDPSLRRLRVDVLPLVSQQVTHGDVEHVPERSFDIGRDCRDRRWERGRFRGTGCVPVSFPLHRRRNGFDYFALAYDAIGSVRRALGVAIHVAKIGMATPEVIVWRRVQVESHEFFALGFVLIWFFGIRHDYREDTSLHRLRRDRPQSSSPSLQNLSHSFRLLCQHHGICARNVYARAQVVGVEENFNFPHLKLVQQPLFNVLLHFLRLFIALPRGKNMSCSNLTQAVCELSIVTGRA